MCSFKKNIKKNGFKLKKSANLVDIVFMSCYILNFSAVASITDGFANTSWAVAHQNDRRIRK